MHLQGLQIPPCVQKMQGPVSQNSRPVSVAKSKKKKKKFVVSHLFTADHCPFINPLCTCLFRSFGHPTCVHKQSPVTLIWQPPSYANLMQDTVCSAPCVLQFRILNLNSGLWYLQSTLFLIILQSFLHIGLSRLPAWYCLYITLQKKKHVYRTSCSLLLIHRNFRSLCMFVNYITLALLHLSLSQLPAL